MSYIKTIAFTLILTAVFFLVRQWRTIQGHEITKGVVSELIPTIRSKGGTSYKVVAKFNDRQGKQHLYRASWSSNPPTHRLGEEFPIMYDSNNPEENYALSFGTRFGFFWGMLGAGLLLLWISFGWQYGNDYILKNFPYTH